MKAIVAVSDDWGIGNKNELLFHIPEDMKRFKELTIHNVIIMGRKTFESLPNQKPLKDRTNIVITSSGKNFGNGIITSTFEGLQDILDMYQSKKCFVIGGESVYSQLLDRCDTIYVTKIFKSVEYDKKFVNLDRVDGWKCVEHSPVKTYNSIRYQFCIYKKEESK